jgi:hypothetical protein
MLWPPPGLAQSQNFGDRKRQETGEKVGGRRSVAEMHPETAALAHKLARKRPKGGQRSLREIATELAAAGHMTSNGTPYTATAVKRLLEEARAAVKPVAPQPSSLTTLDHAFQGRHASRVTGLSLARRHHPCESPPWAEMK